MTRWYLALVLLCTAATGCVSTAPPIVQDALTHQLEDFALLEAELLPLVPEDATVTFTSLSGEEKTRPARDLWRERIRAFLFRGAGLVAWSRGETYDPDAAFRALFPEKVSE